MSLRESKKVTSPLKRSDGAYDTDGMLNSMTSEPEPQKPADTSTE